MKYIRTKDGIEKLDANREHLAEYMNGKQADTIEELCDEFVLISNPAYASRTPIKIDFEKKIIYQWRFGKNVAEYTFKQFLPFHTIYGAIWVDGNHDEPILKSVAKMNEKGELELL